MLPDRVIVPTCIGCGAMGRAARCPGGCSEHKLRLVSAADLDALCAAARSARALVAIARTLTDSPSSEDGCAKAYRALRLAAQTALDRAGGSDEQHDWTTPATRTGWWCAQCGNVDAPEPCIDVCIWRELDWVNEAIYTAECDRAISDLRAVPALVGLFKRIIAVTPREGRCRDTWQGFETQAGRAVDDDPGCSHA